MLKTKVTLILVSVILLTSAAWADVKLPAIFGDHMVLQQKNSVPVWGWADPDEKVTVKGSWQWFFGKSVKADENGKWKVSIKTPKAGKRVTLNIKGRKNKIVLKDVLIGEVWVCSGQSNMEWKMNMLKTDRAKADIAKAGYPKGKIPQIRLFTVKKVFSTTPKEDVEGTWQVCTPETAGAFSATGYYFGKNLHESLDVPVGLISSNWGGTRAEAWTSQERLAKFDRFSDELQRLANSEKADTARIDKIPLEPLEAWEKQIDKLDAGIRQRWYAKDFNDSGWKDIEMPKTWSEIGLGNVDGIVWYRRMIKFPPFWARDDMEIRLGTIDDVATVWFNGVKLGTIVGNDQKQTYRIPKELIKVGSNEVAVRVVDTGGEGGFTGVQDDLRYGPPGSDLKVSATAAYTWKYKLSHKTTKLSANSVSVLHNGMIAPLVPFRIAGAIWYQGESNCYDPTGYQKLFPAMIEDWREKWDQGDFPFYYVQIAPYSYNGNTRSQALREAQMMTLDAVDNVGMAVTMDIGEETDIHPRNKHDVGDRLARLALAKTYGKNDVVYSGPIYKGMNIEGDSVRISFDYAAGGLKAKDGKLTDFMIAGADKKFAAANAVIDGEKIVVSSDEVKEPVAVRYGWSNWVQGSLFNKAGLPASSFRTDDWSLK